MYSNLISDDNIRDVIKDKSYSFKQYFLLRANSIKDFSVSVTVSKIKSYRIKLEKKREGISLKTSLIKKCIGNKIRTLTE